MNVMNHNLNAELINVLLKEKKNDSLKHLVEVHGDILAIISENFSSLFPIFEKLEIMEKISNKEQENVKSKNTVNSVDI